jgi:hypothetical protein
MKKEEPKKKCVPSKTVDLSVLVNAIVWCPVEPGDIKDPKEEGKPS